MKRLVIVESPTKARTIKKFLPAGYEVTASLGHVRDLPASAADIPAKYKKEKWSRLGVDVAKGFEPLYVVPKEKKKVVQELKSALKGIDELFIATDEDREGESIGWHVLELLKPKVPVRRMVFHEITKKAILAALEDTREIDRHLVDAQETRRILDRLVGYTLSPLLWRKIAPRLSAGRVQSVAVRLLVLRERERISFVPAHYWTLKAVLEKEKSLFEAAVTHVDDQRVATSRDFDPDTGLLLKGKDVLILQEERAKQLAERLRNDTFLVTNVDEKVNQRKPYPPFVTSTLQQEANRKLRFSARHTMRVAQKLYEQGYITYMRTDSTNIAEDAIVSIRKAVDERYGAAYLSPSARRYKASSKNAQEAHEAIRPAGTDMKTQAELKLTGDEGALYKLIWMRTLATQMANAKVKNSTVTIVAGEDEPVTFRATGRSVEFPGFFRAYVEGSDDPEAALEDRDQPLPPLVVGDQPDSESIEPQGKETNPPQRYSEASLVKKLEAEGVGRPSTYASIIDTIINRGYARKNGTQLYPTFTAFATTRLLEDHFSRMVDLGFTAGMEQILDDISEGEKAALPYLTELFNGNDGLENRVKEGLDTIDAREVSTLVVEKWAPYVVRVGKYGAYVEVEEDGERLTANVPEDAAPGDVTRESLADMIKRKLAGDEVLGIHPEFDEPVFVKKGPYGSYVQMGEDSDDKKPKRVSLPKNVLPEQVDFEKALELLRLPRELGLHPETGVKIVANVGRFGPYVQHQRIFASLKKEDDVLEVDLERALELIAQKVRKNSALRVVGLHPADEQPIEVWEGRYGPYVKHDGVNASLPKTSTIESVTLEEAVELLKQQAAKPKTKRRTRKRT